MGAVDAQSYEVSDEEPSEESDHESSDEKPHSPSITRTVQNEPIGISNTLVTLSVLAVMFTGMYTYHKARGVYHNVVKTLGHRNANTEEHAVDCNRVSGETYSRDNKCRVILGSPRRTYIRANVWSSPVSRTRMCSWF